MIGVIVQARTGSTRLPEKVLKHVGDQTVLSYGLNRLRRSRTPDRIIVATTTEPKDDRIASLCEDWDKPYFRGREQDVLSRYYHCAREYDVETVVRITSDCPLIDFRVVDRVITEYKQSSADFVTNNSPRTFPHGMDLAVFSFDLLEKAYKQSDQPAEREHVTPWIRSHSSLQDGHQFSARNVRNEIDFSHVRLTVDYPEDLEVVRFLINKTSIDAPWQQYIAVLTKHPEYIECNRQHVEH